MFVKFWGVNSEVTPIISHLLSQLLHQEAWLKECIERPGWGIVFLLWTLMNQPWLEMIRGLTVSEERLQVQRIINRSTFWSRSSSCSSSGLFCTYITSTLLELQAPFQSNPKGVALKYWPVRESIQLSVPVLGAGTAPGVLLWNAKCNSLDLASTPSAESLCNWCSCLTAEKKCMSLKHMHSGIKSASLAHKGIIYKWQTIGWESHILKSSVSRVHTLNSDPLWRSFLNPSVFKGGNRQPGEHGSPHHREKICFHINPH